MSRRLLVLDNYDSFTYNLVHLIREIGGLELEVHRNDAITLAEVGRFSEIVLSPGPGVPQEAGIMPELVRQYGETKRILGVCLGHQCIGEVFGGTLHNLSRPVHGVATDCSPCVANELMFCGLPETFSVGRYHSWVVAQENFPDSLEVTAIDSVGEIMALRHRTLNVRGVQFHPESVLTPDGRIMIQNWLNE
jgi:anthranilate synthase component 2